MVKSRPFGVLCVLMIFNIPSILNAEFLYGLSTDAADLLYGIDTSDLGNPTLVGSIDFEGDLSGLVRLADGNLYTFDRTSNSLILLDPTTAAVLSIVAIDRDLEVQPRGYDISPDGTLYIIANGMKLYSLDATTGTTTLKTSIFGSVSSEAIAFAPDGTLYAVGGDKLYTIDITTGETSFISYLYLPDIDCLTYSSDGYLYGADSFSGSAYGFADLYRISPSTGHVDNLGSAGITGFNGIAATDSFPINVTIEVTPDGTEQECTQLGGSIVQLTAGVESVDIASILWTIDDVTAGDTQSITTPLLGLGQHSVRVDVISENGSTGTDSIVVSVVDSTPPEASAAFIDVKTNNATNTISNGSRIIPSVSVTDICDDEPEIYATTGVSAAKSFIANKTGTGLVINAESDTDQMILTVTATDASGNQTTVRTVAEVTK